MNQEEKALREGIELVKSGLSTRKAAEEVIKNNNLSIQPNTFRSRILRAISKDRSGDLLPENVSELEAECAERGIDPNDVSHYWWKGEHFSIFAKPGQKTYEQVKDDIVAEMKAYAPDYPKIQRNKVVDGHLFVFDPADVHIGKLCDAFETGENYDAQIAVKRVLDGVHGIINKLDGWNIEKILYIIGNDKLHIDTPRRTTTSGTPQDTTGMWYSNFLIAKRLDIEIIEILRAIAPVHVQYDPSNHDYTNGFFLADTIASWFSKCDDVTFNVGISHRKYFTYGENLIGTTHGDGAKVQDLPLLMAQEAAQEWAKCRHRYFYMHHLHHKVSKDYGSVCVEALRSPSGTDSWHHRNGYQHSPKAVEAFIHHPKQGQVARITHIF